MGKESDAALETLDRVVFKGARPIVVAFTAGWGEGKTYFWKNSVVPQYRASKPGYISVFGAESLNAIRERLVLERYSLDKPIRGESPTCGWQRVFAPPLRLMNSVSTHFVGERLGLSDSLIVSLMQGTALKPGWVVCIDD